MKRAVLHDVKKLVLENNAPRPDCPADGLLVKVKVCAVCATDVKIYNYGHRLLKLPRVLGHEISGTIVEVGEQVNGRFDSGQKVAICAVVNCGECIYCRRAIPSMCTSLQAFGYHFDGGYQEYMAVPGAAIKCGGINVLSDRMGFEEAAVAELLACCINGQRLSHFRLGQNVLIIGSGPVGILHAQLATNNGAQSVYLADIDPARLAQARDICGSALSGTFLTGNTESFVRDVQETTGGYGFDQIMICCSVPQIQRLSLELVAKCGCVNFFGGLPKGNSEVLLDTNHIHYKQCTVVGTHGSSAEENRIALELISRGRINVSGLISQRIPLEDLENALAGRNGGSSLKTVVVFD